METYLIIDLSNYYVLDTVWGTGQIPVLKQASILLKEKSIQKWRKSLNDISILLLFSKCQFSTFKPKEAEARAKKKIYIFSYFIYFPARKVASDYL